MEIDIIGIIIKTCIVAGTLVIISLCVTLFVTAILFSFGIASLGENAAVVVMCAWLLSVCGTVYFGTQNHAKIIAWLQPVIERIS